MTLHVLSSILWLRLLGRLNRLGFPLGGGEVKEDDAAVVGTTDNGRHDGAGLVGMELLGCCRTAAYLTRAGTAPVGLAI